MIPEELNTFPEFTLYSMNANDKRSFFTERLIKLFNHHCLNSIDFKRMMNGMGYVPEVQYTLESLPFLPVRLFKLMSLKSAEQADVIKTMTSSGTTGQAVSKIYLDKNTSSLQTKVLGKIVSKFIGSSRVPMIIIDSEATIKNRNQFSARAAGIMGFSMFGTKKVFALNDDMSLNEEVLNHFIAENQDKTILLFGFTFIVYQHFYRELLKTKTKLNLQNGVLIHGGGWKKLINEAVDSSTFRKNLHSVCGLNRVHDYYGMVEQTGTIHMECEYGYLHTSEYSEILIRNPKNFSVCKFGEEGLIQLLSLLPLSYPGHSILTEDIGTIIGEDTCSCGRLGKYFKVSGRIKNAEIRGCSDTYATNI